MRMDKFLPPTYFWTLMVMGIELDIFFPITRVLYPLYSYIGIAPIIAGIYLNLWADRLFKERKTTVKPFEKPVILIEEGPFRISRNPMYLGMLLILVGEAILFGVLSVFVIPWIFFCVMEISFIEKEERDLEEVFDRRYSCYKKRV